MRAALYGRFSTDHQRPESIADQFRVAERLAAEHGFRVVAKFSDAAISGGTARRPGYQQLLAAARAGEFDAIVVEDVSRLWRNSAEQQQRLAELHDLGICVVGRDLDTRAEGSHFVGAIFGATNEHYRREIGRKTYRGLEGNAIARKPTGGKCFGYVAARDSLTGQIEINEQEADVVRRIFTWYAEGMSPRAIAAKLNEEGVPSPGSTWNRKSRRTAGWLASAIHGDAKRGVGILSNWRYIGRVKWGRMKWHRSYRDSARRQPEVLGKAVHEYQDERLRIVPQNLWDTVRARQAMRSHTLGAKVKNGLRKRAPGGGRPARYVLSGLLRCGVCDASFVLSNGERYQCSSHVNGGACSNRISVRRDLVETRVIDTVQADLADPEFIAEFERSLRLAARKPKAAPNHRERINELRQELTNLADAIAQGLLRSSPTLASRLAAAEAELQRLEAADQAPKVRHLAPNVRERCLGILRRLQQTLGSDPERARAALVDAIGPRIILDPDQSGKFLWADFGLEPAPLLAVAGGSEIMVAGAGFEPATFGL
jgi:site-specific DNA recombinase